MKTHFDLLEVEEMKKKWKCLKQRHFEYRNKPGKYLAHCLRKERKKRGYLGSGK